MPLRVGCRADDADKHEFDVNFLLYKKGKLYSAGDDGRIKVGGRNQLHLLKLGWHHGSFVNLNVYTIKKITEVKNETNK